MNNKLNIYLIITAIIVLIGYFIGKNIYIKNFSYKNNNINKLFLKQLNTKNTIERVKKIQIFFNGEKLTIVYNKDNDKWVVLEKNNYPVLEQKVKELIFDLANLKIVDAKTAKQENFATLQLEDLNVNKQNTEIILFNDAEQEIENFYIGKREFIASPNADGQSHIFVRRSLEIQAWLVTGKLLESFAFKDFVKQPVLSLNTTNISQIELDKTNQPSKNTIKIAKDAKTGSLTLLEVPPRFKIKEQYAVDNIIQQFAYLNYEDVILNSKEAVPVLFGKIVTTTSEQPISFELVYLNKNYYLKLNSLENNVAIDNNWLYKISDYACQSLMIKKNDLLTEIVKTNDNSKKVK